MKLWNYIFILTGLSTIAAISGLNIAGVSDLLRIIGVTNLNIINSATVQGTLWNKIFGTDGLLTSIKLTGAIGLGTFIYTKDKAFLMVPLITGVTITWGSVVTSLIQQKGGYSVFGTILTIICLALSVGFVQSCVDYFMGLE